MNPKDSDTRNLTDQYKGLDTEDIKNDMRKRSFDYHVAIENFQYDFNIGAVVRNANAFNTRAVHIIGKRQWNKRGAMATNKYLDVLYHDSVKSFITWRDKENITLIGVDNIPSSKSIRNFQFPKECVLVFGQEGPGLSSEMIGYCKNIIKIDQYGSTRSINVGVASGIVMYEYVSQIKKINL